MTKAEAIRILINDFHNQCIAIDWDLCDTDKEICKALNIKPPTKAEIYKPFLRNDC